MQLSFYGDIETCYDNARNPRGVEQMTLYDENVIEDALNTPDAPQLQPAPQALDNDDFDVSFIILVAAYVIMSSLIIITMICGIILHNREEMSSNDQDYGPFDSAESLDSNSDAAYSDYSSSDDDWMHL